MTFRRFIWLSVFLHALAALSLMFRAFLTPSEPLDLQDAIRVDIVGLPQKISPEQPLPPEPAAKTAAAPEPSKPEPKPERAPPPPPKPEAPKFVEKPKVDVKQSQKSALNRLKEMDAFAKLEKQAEAKRAAAARATPPPIAGHKVTSGNSLTGIERLDYDRYGAALKARVIENWHVPAWLAESELSARVRVWLDDAGHVTKKQIIRSSGNDVFDAAALDAVTASDPFPAPPDNLRGVIANQGFTLGLPR